MRGRVMGFYTMAFLGMYPVGGLAAGALASWIGATHTLALGGACCMLCALWLAAPAARAAAAHAADLRAARPHAGAEGVIGDGDVKVIGDWRNALSSARITNH